MSVGPFQIHAQKHGSPVLGFGAAGAGLDVEKCVMRVHLAREHALEFELFDFVRQPVEVSLDFFDCARIGLLCGQFQKFRGIAQGAFEPV